MKSKGDGFRIMAVQQARRRIQESAKNKDLFYHMVSCELLKRHPALSQDPSD
jgi:hypothetical protein